MKIHRRLILAAVIVSAASTMAACSSSALPAAGPGLVPNGLAATRVAKKVPVAVRIFIPRRHHGDAASLRPFFVANSTRGIAVIVAVHGSSSPVSTTNAGVAAGSALCKAAAGGRQCTVSAQAPPGSDDFTIKTFDAAPSGSGFSGAKQLAIGSTTKTIAAGKRNSLNVTVGGVVAKSAVNLSWPINPVIDPDTQTVTVSALDADGNTIINDGWYSATGTAVKMAMSASNASAGMFTFSSTSVTFASPSTKLTFDSTKISSAQAQNGFTSSISATPSNGATTGSATFTLSKPAITEFQIATSGSSPEGIEVGPDNEIWFAESSGGGAMNPGGIGTIATSAAAGTVTADYRTGISNFASPTMLANGGGEIWFTEFGTGNIASIDPTSHTIAEHLTPSGSGDQPYGITAGPDGNMWFTENCSAHSNIGKFSPTALYGGVGIILEYGTHTAHSDPAWIASGPDKNLWFTENAVDKIGNITTGASPTANDFALNPNSIGQGQITSGPDNALWFTEENPGAGVAADGHRIGRVTTGGSITLPYAFTNTFTSAMGIVTGPDGALWFAENGNNAIGRIDPATHTVVEFDIHALGGGTGTNPWGIVKGPDGSLWFTECLNDKIGKLR